jgi:hypothetical protein
MSIKVREQNSNRIVKGFIKRLNMSGLSVCNMPDVDSTECRSLHIIENIRICLKPFKFYKHD